MAASRQPNLSLSQALEISDDPTISLAEKNCAISCTVVSGASEPSTEFAPIPSRVPVDRVLAFGAGATTGASRRHDHLGCAPSDYNDGSRQMSGLRDTRFALRRRSVYVTYWNSDSLERF